MLIGMQSEPTPLASAFPAALASDVEAVLAVMPEPEFQTQSWHSVDVLGDRLAVLGRIYHPKPEAAAVQALSPRQLTILQCLYTRHHNGYVRQQYVGDVVGSTEPWVIPFIIEITGEYIPEILVAIRRGLPELDVPGSAHNLGYGQFIRDNPAYFNRAQRRVVSYWSCYWRHTDYPSFQGYPGCSLLESFRAAASTDKPWPRLTPPGAGRLDDFV
jgi:hypothetical protein